MVFFLVLNPNTYMDRSVENLFLSILGRDFCELLLLQSSRCFVCLLTCPLLFPLLARFLVHHHVLVIVHRSMTTKSFLLVRWRQTRRRVHRRGIVSQCLFLVCLGVVSASWAISLVVVRHGIMLTLIELFRTTEQSFVTPVAQQCHMERAVVPPHSMVRLPYSGAGKIAVCGILTTLDAEEGSTLRVIEIY